MDDEESSRYVLKIRQQPKQARSAGFTDRPSSNNKVDRRPLDPLPILQLDVQDPVIKRTFLSNPFYFVYATLIHPDTNEEIYVVKGMSLRAITGTIASSLYRLKDTDSSYGGFFFFPEISIRIEGRYRLRFTLFEIIDNVVLRRKSTVSDPFMVYNNKTFPGVADSTPLSKFFADQGLKIRISRRKGAQRRLEELDAADDFSLDRKRNRSISHDERGDMPSHSPVKRHQSEILGKHPDPDAKREFPPHMYPYPWPPPPPGYYPPMYGYPPPHRLPHEYYDSAARPPTPGEERDYYPPAHGYSPHMYQYPPYPGYPPYGYPYPMPRPYTPPEHNEGGAPPQGSQGSVPPPTQGHAAPVGGGVGQSGGQRMGGGPPQMTHQYPYPPPPQREVGGYPPYAHPDYRPPPHDQSPHMMYSRDPNMPPPGTTTT
ncbi:velvet factor-domain-containing protein [Cladochytrium replicatum]|nr:velvet factor-domain-containing protein [Cladochytrium replicatum]